MFQFPKAIIISGTGRNVGKTTLACQLIAKYKAENPIAIKISPHRHDLDSLDAMQIIEWNNDFAIVEELHPGQNKDSERMLSAGAKRVFFIMAEDRFLPQCVSILLQHFSSKSRMIIESAALRRIVQPEKFIVVSSSEFPLLKPKNRDMEAKVDEWLRFDGVDFYKV